MHESDSSAVVSSPDKRLRVILAEFGLGVVAQAIVRTWGECTPAAFGKAIAEGAAVALLFLPFVASLRQIVDDRRESRTRQ